MTTKGRKYFSGNTLDHALMQAARHHGLQPGEVAYRKIEKRHGFLRSRKGVVIEVNPESPRIPEGRESAPEGGESAPAMAERERFAPADEEIEMDEEDKIDEPQEEPEPEARGGDMVWGQPDDVESETDVTPEDWPAEDLMDAAKRALQDILDFARLDLEFEIEPGEGQLEIELGGPDRELLIEDRGNLLLAIQHLLPRLIRGYAGRSIPCHVDSESFHETREIELRKLAEEAAAEVRQEQRPRTLPPMNPAERRIIHVTLADEKDLKTESQGRGFFKRVTISPAMRRPRGFDRYSR